jgi:hypothetical protein
VAGGPNGNYSLTEARLNFAQYGHMYRPSDARGSDKAQDCELRDALLAHFQSLLPTVSEEAFIRAYPLINDAFTSIAEALSVRVKKREIQIHKER